MNRRTFGPLVGLLAIAILVAGCDMVTPPPERGSIEDLAFWLDAPAEANSSNIVWMEYVLQNQGDQPVEVVFDTLPGTLGYDLAVTDSNGREVFRNSEQLWIAQTGTQRAIRFSLQPGEKKRQVAGYSSFPHQRIAGERLPGGTYYVQAFLFDMMDQVYVGSIAQPNYRKYDPVLETEPVPVLFR